MSDADLDRLFALAAQLKAVQEEMDVLLERGVQQQVKGLSPGQAVSIGLIRALKPEGHDQKTGEMLQIFRESADLTVSVTARRMGGYRPDVLAIEGGKRSPTVRTLVRQADALGAELLIGIQRKTNADGPD